MILVFSSCSNYYKVISSTGPARVQDITNLNNEHKYFIVHDNYKAYAMENIAFTADHTCIQGTLINLPEEHTHYLNKGKKDKQKYSKYDQNGKIDPGLLNEVHLYTSPDSNLVPGPYTLPLSMLKKTAIIEKDVERTNRNHTIVIASVIIGTPLLLIGLLGVAIAMSGGFVL